jgi:hypothetical protein
MGIFDRFKKKQQPEEPYVRRPQPSLDAIAAQMHQRKQEDPEYGNRNFVGDLVDYFSKNEQVTDAAFGHVPDKEGKYHLFLSVGMTGDEESIKRMTGLMKSVHIPQAQLNFASNLSDEGIYRFIGGSSFAFYEKGKDTSLRRDIMRHWFEPEKYKQELIDTLKKSRLCTLLKDFDPNGNSLFFQTYVRDSGEFIPLFSDRDMITKSGMSEIPENLTVIDFDFGKINEVLEGGLNGKFFVLDPGTSFEVEFYG